VSADESFEPVIDAIRPTASRRARSAVGLVILLSVLGVVTAVVITVLVIGGVIVLNNAL
jgi:high-affinity Fe2+/Pb2+ permease